MKISVNLYGGKGIFGGKETPLEADEIYCEMFDQCSFYKEGKCLRCRSFLAPTCRFGRNNITKGYTSRAQKYYTFKSKYQSDEVYGKLSYPNRLVAVIGDTLYMNLKYTLVMKKKDDSTRYCKCIEGYEISDRGFCNCDIFIPISDITNNLLYNIFSFKPQAMMGGHIKDYNEKVVPEVLLELKKLLPDIYSSFITEHPEFDFTPNYIGKKAYINSLKPGTKFKYKNKEWYYDGEFVSTTNFDIGASSPWWLSDGKYSEIVKIKVNNKMLFEISDNSIVDEDTKFE